MQRLKKMGLLLDLGRSVWFQQHRIALAKINFQFEKKDKVIRILAKLVFWSI